MRVVDPFRNGWEIEPTIEALTNLIASGIGFFSNLTPEQVRVDPYPCADLIASWGTHAVSIDGFGLWGFTDGPLAKPEPAAKKEEEGGKNITKHTLQEIADFFGCWVAVYADGDLLGSELKPLLDDDGWSVGTVRFRMDRAYLRGYFGDWKDSLTAPSEPPFKEGELVIYGSGSNDLARWNSAYMIPKDWRRPTKAQWKKLRGEE